FVLAALLLALPARGNSEPLRPPPPPAAPEAAGQPDYTGRTIARVEVRAPHGYSAAELQRFLEIRAGDPYSIRQIRRTIEVLSKLGEFSSIDVSAAEEGAGIALVFRLVSVP